MPELPEVETVCRGLRSVILDEEIKDINVRRRDFRVATPISLESVCKGQKVKAISRRAKYIILHLENNIGVIIHLGMSGRMRIKNSSDPGYLKHDHIIFTMLNGNEAIFHDPRRFGLVTYANINELEKHKLLKDLGPEPLGNNFTDKYLFDALKNRNIAIKQAIMTNEVVVGVGNIYASESLYMAGISPFAASNSLSLKRVGLLVKAIKEVLSEAIKAGGSTLKDYAQTSGEQGYFQHQFKVYGQEGKECKICLTIIAKTKQQGRSTFYCNKCQK